MSVRISAPIQPLPSCRCSACILTPESSHGMHMIGAYRPRVYLTMRGNTLPSGVSYTMPYEASKPRGGGRGLVAQVFPSAQGADYTVEC